MRYEADEAYRQFNQRLTQTSYEMIGVRVPVLKELAKQLLKEQTLLDLLQHKPIYFEDVMLRGFLIARANISVEERQLFLEQHMQWLDNWQTVDSVCSALKEAKKEKEHYWQWLLDMQKEENTYTTRFVIVMYLMYFLEDQYIDEVYLYLQTIKNDDYYVRMAIAWAISIAFIKQPSKTRVFLKNATLPNWTYNKALQKIIESRQVSEEVKIEVRKWRK